MRVSEVHYLNTFAVHIRVASLNPLFLASFSIRILPTSCLTDPDRKPVTELNT